MRPSDPSLNDEHVAGMRIGVEEAVLQHLVEHRAKQPIGQLPPISPVPLTELLGISDGDPFEPLLDEQPAGAEVAVDARDADAPDGPTSVAISAIASASRRKSSSARRLRANWSSTSPVRML